MDTPLSNLHLVLYYLALLCIHGKGQGLNPSCGATMRVHRGTVWKTLPQRNLTINCTVSSVPNHCGKLLHVTWCKITDKGKCEPINKTGNIGMRQDNSSSKHELTSFLDFKPILIHDEGLYRCESKGPKNTLLSHAINISFSNESSTITDHEAERVTSVPYIAISVSVVLLVFTVVVISLLSFYSCNRLMINSQTKGQEISTHMLPDIPKDSIASAPVLQAHISNLYDIYPRCNAETSTSISSTSPSLMTGGNPPENTAGGDEGSDYVVYTILNHLPSGTPLRAQHTTTQQDEHSHYAAIKFS